MKKILVGITIQENSRRLINTGYLLSKKLAGELHILHIRKGDSIFETPDDTSLFEELFAYGSDLGGQVHFLCSNDVPDTIHQFIVDHEITHLVVGKPNNKLKDCPNLYEKIKETVDAIELISLDRED